jgi:hypothetical protein
MYVTTELGNVKGCGSVSKPLTSSRKQGGAEKLLLLALAKCSWPIGCPAAWGARELAGWHHFGLGKVSSKEAI